MRQFTSEERIRRVWDKEEAKAVLCRHAYLEAANRRAESLASSGWLNLSIRPLPPMGKTGVTMWGWMPSAVIM